MPDDNPSFYVLTISRADVPKVEKAIQRFLSSERGGILKPIAQSKYVIVRSAIVAMRAKYNSRPLMLDFLRKLKGVILVQPMDGAQLQKAYEVGLLDPDDPDPDFEAHLPEDGVPEHLDVVNARKAWDFFEQQAAKPIGSVSVAHLDTGITQHPVFGKWTNGRAPTVRPDLGLDLVSSGNPPFDPVTVNYPGNRGHGTKTASTLAGTNEKTMLGMARGVTLIPYRVTKTVVIDTFEKTPLDRALKHAWEANACQVASISLGDPCDPSAANAAAINAAYLRGMIVAAAAGNITSEVTFPGSHPCTITAGGVNLDGTPWAGGARGIMVDICAPANGIFRAETVADPKSKKKDKELYAYGRQGDGTSYATTLVAGAAALWLARWGDELAQYTEGWMRVEAFRACVRASAHTPKNWDTRRFGAGILKVDELLKTDLPAPKTLVSRLLVA